MGDFSLCPGGAFQFLGSVPGTSGMQFVKPVWWSLVPGTRCARAKIYPQIEMHPCPAEIRQSGRSRGILFSCEQKIEPKGLVASVMNVSPPSSTVQIRVNCKIAVAVRPQF